MCAMRHTLNIERSLAFLCKTPFYNISPHAEKCTLLESFSSWAVRGGVIGVTELFENIFPSFNKVILIISRTVSCKVMMKIMKIKRGFDSAKGVEFFMFDIISGVVTGSCKH